MPRAFSDHHRECPALRAEARTSIWALLALGPTADDDRWKALGIQTNQSGNERGRDQEGYEFIGDPRKPAE